MPVKFGALVKSLASKMKMNLEDEKLKPLFAIDTEVDDTIAAQFEAGLMAEEGAIANTNIRNKIRGEVFNGFDAVLDELMGDYEFDDAAKDEVKNGGTSFKKQKIVAKKIAELQEKKANSGSQKGKEAIQKQIDDLNTTMANLKTTHAAELAKIQAAADERVYDIRLNSKLEGKKYYNEDVPASIHAMTARQLLNQQLAQAGAKLIWDETLKSYKLLNAETGVDYHDPKTNNKLSPDDFIDGVLAENKMLKTSTPGSDIEDPNQHHIATPGADSKVPVNNSMLNAINAQLGAPQGS